MTEMTTTRGGRTGGPPPGVLALVSFGLTLAGVVLGGLLSGGEALSSPYQATADLVRGIRENPDAVRLAAFFQFGAAIPLGIYAAAVYARQLRLGVRVAGPVIGLVGGLIAVFSLLVSAFATYVTSRPEVTVDPPLTHALAFFSFVAGGPGYVVGLGLLIAGVAVPALILRLVPRWLAGVGLVLALACELSWLGLLAEPMQYLLPVGRFLGGVWLIAAGFALPVRRPRRTEAGGR